jgi:Galactose oxidase, central domain
VVGTIAIFPGGEARRTGEVYDPASNTWSATGQLTAPRTDHVTVRLTDGRILVAGSDYDRTAEIYDPATNSWTATGSMNDGRSDFTATLLPDGRVLAVGGHGGSLGILATAELYDPATGRWSRTAGLRIPRWRHTATLLADGTVLVAGGLSTGGIGWPRDAERFDPSRARWHPDERTAGPGGGGDRGDRRGPQQQPNNKDSDSRRVPGRSVCNASSGINGAGSSSPVPCPMVKVCSARRYSSQPASAVAAIRRGTGQ